MMKFKTLRNLMASMLVVGVAASVVGVGSGTFALFNASTTTTATFQSGNISISNSAPAGFVLVTPTRIIPGDTFGGTLDVTNTAGNVDFNYTLSTGSVPSNALFTDATEGLKIWIQRC